MKQRPGSIGSSTPSVSPAPSEEAVNRVLVAMHSKLKELEGKYTALVTQCKGMTVDNRTRSRESIDVSFFDESQYLQHLRALDEDKEKVESELNYILKAKKTLTLDSASREDETVKQIYAELSEALGTAQTQVLKMLQNSDWAVRNRATDVFTALSDAVWTQVSLLRSRTESREMKELLNEVVRLEQSKQVLDIQTEEFQESIRQKYKSRHYRDKRKITSLQAEVKRLEASLQEVLSSNRALVRSTSSSLNVSLKPSSRQPQHYRSARSSVSPGAKKRACDYTEDLGVAEKELLFHSLISEPRSVHVKTAAAQTNEQTDLEVRFRLLASAAKKYAQRTQKLVKRAKDPPSEEALQALFQALDSASLDESTDFEVFSVREKQSLELANATLEKDNARLEAMLQEQQEKYSRLHESLEKIQRAKPESSEQVRRLTLESHALAAKVKDLEHALESESKASKKLKRDHKAALEDLIKDCTELTEEVKLLSEEKAQLLASYERRNRDYEQERVRTAATLRDAKAACAQLLQSAERGIMEELRDIDLRVRTVGRRVEEAVESVPQSVFALVQKIEREKNSTADNEKLAMENSRLKAELGDMRTVVEEELQRLRLLSSSQAKDLQSASSQLSEEQAISQSLRVSLKSQSEQTVQREDTIRSLQSQISVLLSEKEALEKRCEDLLGMEESHKSATIYQEIREESQEASFSFEDRKADEREEVNLGTGVDVYSAQIEELEHRIAEIQSAKDLNAEELAAANGNITALRADLEAREEEIETLKNSVGLLSKEVESVKGELEEVRKRAESEGKLKQQFAGELIVARQECVRLKAEKEALSQRNRDSLTALEGQMREMERRHEGEIAALQESIREKQVDNEGLRRTVSDLQESESANAEELSRLAAELQAKESEVAGLQRAVEGLQEDRTRHLEEIAELHSELQDKTAEIDTYQRQTDDLMKGKLQQVESLSTLSLTSQQKDREIAVLKQSIESLRLEKAAEVGKLAAEVEEKRKECRELHEKLHKSTASLKESADKLATLNAGFEQCRDRLEWTENQLKIANSNLETAKSDINNSEKSWKRQREESESQLARLNLDIKAIEERYCTLQEDAEKRAADLLERLQTAEEHLSQAQESSKTSEEQVAILQERLRHAEQEVATFRETLLETGEKLTAAEDKARNSESQWRSAEMKAKSAEDRALSAETKCKNAEERAKAAEAKSQLSEDRSKSSEEKQRRAEDRQRSTEEKFRRLETRVKELETFSQAQNTSLGAKVAEIQSLRDAVTAAEIALAGKSQEVEALKSTQSSLQDQVSHLTGKLSSTQLALDQTSAELSAVTGWVEQVSEYVGTPQSSAEALRKLQESLRRERLLTLRLSLWANEVEVQLGEGDLERSLELFTQALALVVRERRALDAVVKNTNSSVEFELEKKNQQYEALVMATQSKERELEVCKRQLEAANVALQEERKASFSRIEDVEKQYEVRLREKMNSLSSELAAKENRCAVLEAELDSLRKQYQEEKILSEDLQTQLTQKMTEIDTLTEALKSQQKYARPISPNFEFAEEEVEAIAPQVEAEDSFATQIKGIVGSASSPGQVLKTVEFDGCVWSLVCSGEKKYVWLLQKESEDSISDEDMEEKYRKAELEIVKKQQTISRIEDLLRPHTNKGFPDVVLALESVLSAKSPAQKPGLIPRLVVSGIKDNSDGLLDTPRLLSARSPREPSSSMEKQFQAIDRGVREHGREVIAEESNSFERGEGLPNQEPHSFNLSQSSLEEPVPQSHHKSSGFIQRDMNKLQQELQERDKRLREDAQQIIVLQTENLRLKTDVQDYENTVGKLEAQLKLRNEELHRVNTAKKAEAGVSIPMLRNSLLRLIAELQAIPREAEDMVKTLFSLLDISQHQVELVEQARKATKARKVSLLAQLMS